MTDYMGDPFETCILTLLHLLIDTARKSTSLDGARAKALGVGMSVLNGERRRLGARHAGRGDTWVTRGVSWLLKSEKKATNLSLPRLS